MFRSKYLLKVGRAGQVLLLVGLALPLITEPGHADDWPQFRGSSRSGVSAETGLLSTWPEEGPKEVWRHPFGEGYSAITVVDGRLYTAVADDSKRSEDGSPVGSEYAVAFDAQSRDEVWRVEIGPKTFNEFGDGPRTTPTVDGDVVVMLSGTGTLFALSSETGETRWSVNLKETFGTGKAEYGFSTSPIIANGVVVLDVGGPEDKSHAGFDRDTGEVLWAGGPIGPFGPGYSSILPVEIADTTHLVHFSGAHLRAVNPKGEELWMIDWPRGETHAMPVLIPPDMVFGSGAGAVGSTVVAITENGGGFSAAEVWKSPLMRNHFSSSLYHEGHIYGFDNATLKCLDASNGEQKWAKRGFGKGSLIYADSHLVVLSDRGRLVLAEATGEAYREKGSVQALTGKCWTAPVLADGRLYLRNHTEMVAYDLEP